MSLDITIKERKEFRCQDCGRLVTTKDIDAECSSGRVWYDFDIFWGGSGCNLLNNGEHCKFETRQQSSEVEV